jgi:acyl-CoA reductase-like NAD-dependent aldehyde dehydrogenase
VREREKWLINAAAILERDKQQFIDILIDEGGSTIGKAMFELDFSINFLRAAAGSCRHVTGQTLPSDDPSRFSMTIRQPLGVIGCISPFNVPLLKGVKQISMALATGNTVVALPSEETPVVAARLVRVFHEAGIPAGAVNLVTGYGAAIGDFLTTHPLVRMITFTGSTRVGRHIAELCGRNLKRVTLELGGKSPLVVLKDADLKAAVEAAAMGTFMHQGQVCMSSSRIYVERPIVKDFVNGLAGFAKKIPAGNLREPQTILGPIISPRQRERVRTHLNDAIERGARVEAGADWSANVCFATVLTDVKPGMTLYKEETFGPVTSVYAVENVEQALAEANDTEYGLSASVFTSDLGRAFQLAESLNSGMVHINSGTLYDEPHVPFGGVGSSGLGREGTTADIDAMTELKWVTVRVGPQHHP